MKYVDKDGDSLYPSIDPTCGYSVFTPHETSKLQSVCSFAVHRTSCQEKALRYTPAVKFDLRIGLGVVVCVNSTIFYSVKYRLRLNLHICLKQASQRLETWTLETTAERCLSVRILTLSLGTTIHIKVFQNILLLIFIMYDKIENAKLAVTIYNCIRKVHRPGRQMF
jgi:hypothetical protein